MKKLEEVLQSIPPVDETLMDKAQKRLDNLTKPVGSLGRLEELAKRLVGITGREVPEVTRKAILVMAADHGVTEEGVSAYPREVTSQMVDNFLRGGAAINVLSGLVRAKVIVVDMGVAGRRGAHPDLLDRKIRGGTRNMANGPAMSREEAVASIETGVEIVDSEVREGLQVLGTGDMGIGNTTASSAIAAAITGEPVEAVTGRGTGIDDDTLAAKVRVIKQSLQINRPDPDDAVDVLSKVGGFEIGGLAGAMLGAAARRIPVIIDGFISGAAALVATTLEPGLKDYLIAAHRSVEAGHSIVLNHLDLRPLLDLDMRLGEGTGAALAMNIVDASVRILAEMATFGEAGVSERKRA